MMVRVVGVEPTRLAAQEPKSCTSANSAIPAYISGRKNCRYFLLFVLCAVILGVGVFCERMLTPLLFRAALGAIG